MTACCSVRLSLTRKEVEHAPTALWQKANQSCGMFTSPCMCMCSNSTCRLPNQTAPTAIHERRSCQMAAPPLGDDVCFRHPRRASRCSTTLQRCPAARRPPRPAPWAAPPQRARSSRRSQLLVRFACGASACGLVMDGVKFVTMLHQRIVSHVCRRLRMVQPDTPGTSGRLCTLRCSITDGRQTTL